MNSLFCCTFRSTRVEAELITTQVPFHKTRKRDKLDEWIISNSLENRERIVNVQRIREYLALTRKQVQDRYMHESKITRNGNIPPFCAFVNIFALNVSGSLKNYTIKQIEIYDKIIKYRERGEGDGRERERERGRQRGGDIEGEIERGRQRERERRLKIITISKKYNTFQEYSPPILFCVASFQDMGDYGYLRLPFLCSHHQ